MLEHLVLKVVRLEDLEGVPKILGLRTLRV